MRTSQPRSVDCNKCERSRYGQDAEMRPRIRECKDDAQFDLLRVGVEGFIVNLKTTVEEGAVIKDSAD